MKRIVFSLFLLAFSAVGQVALGQPLPSPDTQSVLLRGAELAAAPSLLKGAGLLLGGGRSSTPAVDAAGNPIIWREVRSDADRREGRHVFYRQYLHTGLGNVELFGSEVGFHYRKGDRLSFIGGRQFELVKVTNQPAFSAREAVQRAWFRLLSHPGFEVQDQLPADLETYIAERTELKLVKMGPTFRYAYFTFAKDVHGVPYYVVLDAASEEIMAVTPVNPSSNCSATLPLQAVSAIGYPIRASGTRSLQANVANDRPTPFTHEGFYQALPNMMVTQQTDNPAFKCHTDVSTSYTVFPLIADSGTPVYVDRSGHEWKGNAAGDTLYHTSQAMSALSSLGRNGWDGNWGDANMVIESTAVESSDNAYFILNPGLNKALPSTPSVAVSPAAAFYHMGAALDIIAHEWGHGVIYTSARFDRTFDVGDQLHEGFSDVIGQAVEKIVQSPGDGLEQSSDWDIGEDAGTGGYARSGKKDDACGHTWDGLDGRFRTFNDRLHREDSCFGGFPHDTGNMLNVVFYLMSEGGFNPICARQCYVEGCYVEGCNTSGISVPAVGRDKAAKILFDTVQFYAPYNAQWEDLPEYATYAAFDLYSDCFAGNGAYAEQASVYFAFKAIGYPRLTPREQCP